MQRLDDSKEFFGGFAIFFRFLPGIWLEGVHINCRILALGFLFLLVYPAFLTKIFSIPSTSIAYRSITSYILHIHHLHTIDLVQLQHHEFVNSNGTNPGGFTAQTVPVSCRARLYKRCSYDRVTKCLADSQQETPPDNQQEICCIHTNRP